DTVSTCGVLARSLIATSAPARANSSAQPRPIPRAAPVTSAVLFRSFIVGITSICSGFRLSDVGSQDSLPGDFRQPPCAADELTLSLSQRFADPIARCDMDRWHQTYSQSRNLFICNKLCHIKLRSPRLLTVGDFGYN